MEVLLVEQWEGIGRDVDVELKGEHCTEASNVNSFQGILLGCIRYVYDRKVIIPEDIPLCSLIVI